VQSSGPFAAVLLDLDGTLVDSTASVSRSWARWEAERGLPPGTVRVEHGVPARQILAGLVPDEEVPAAFARIEQLEVEDVAGVVPVPGALDLLATLPDGRWAIVTSGTAVLARARIAAAGLPFPPLLVTADDVRVGKPDPEPYLLAAAKLGVDPGECLVVEDAPAGLAAAEAAGCATLAVTTTYPAERLAAGVVLPDLTGVRFDTHGERVRLVLPGGPPAAR
jgi:sugar-phosphatase